VKRTALVAVMATIATLPVTPAGGSVLQYYCFSTAAPYHAYLQWRQPLPHACDAGHVRAALPGTTTQAIIVAAPSKASTYASFTAYTKTGSSWVLQFGPWTARVGASGMASPGQKIEGDELTPQGTYGFSFMFGVSANPGVKFSWRRAHTYDVWDDDPTSARYNLWTSKLVHWPGRNPEPMHNVPAYNYAAVIAYNTARVPGMGSAIFLHVGTGSATGGCVSLPQAQLLQVIGWLDPATTPMITMAVA